MWTNIGKFLVGLAVGIASIFHPASAVDNQKLGSFTPIQTSVFFLSGAGITNNATSVLLTSMAYSNGSLVSMADLGTIGYATIDPGFPNKEEQVSFTGISQNTNGSALLTGVIRGLAFNPGTQGCNGSSTLAVSHAGGAQFVLSNTACFYTNYGGLSNNNTFTASNTFSNAPTILTPSTNASSAVTYGQLASTSFSGTVNASTTQKGIIQLATPAQIASGTLLGSSGANLVIANGNSCIVSSTTTCSVVASGTLDTSFINSLSPIFNTITATNTISASTTLNGTTTIPNATSSILTTNASGTLSGLQGTATGTLLSFYNGKWNTGLYDTYFATTTSLTSSNALLATIPLPQATLSSIYNFSLVYSVADPNGYASTTLVLTGGGASTTIASCGLNNNSLGFGLSAIGTITMQNSTSSEIVGIPNLSGTTCTPTATNFIKLQSINLASNPSIQIYGYYYNGAGSATLTTNASVNTMQ